MKPRHGIAIARNSAALFAATLLLASCGTPAEEKEPGVAAQPTSTASDTAIPEATQEPTSAAQASDTASSTATDESTSAAPGASDAGSSDAGGSSSAPEGKAAQKGPAMVAYYRSDDLSKILGRDVADTGFPIKSAELNKVVAASLPGENQDGAGVKCASEAAITDAAAAPVNCEYTDATGSKVTAQVHGTKSAFDGAGVIVFPKGDGLSNDALAKALKQPGAEVFVHSHGDMWGIDAPVAADDIAQTVKRSIKEQDREDIDTVTCDAPASITEGTNQVNCEITLTSGEKFPAVTVVTHVATAHENGTLTVLKFPRN